MRPKDIAEEVLEGFDPVNNWQDRRMLYEVTGMRLRSDEFQDDTSSDSGKDDETEELEPIDYAFMERYDGEEDDTGQQAIVTYALNP